MQTNKIYHGDCEQILKTFPNDSIDLIITSPPYADQRKKDTSIKPDAYVEWFLPKSKQFLRVLKPTGTFILNIKERVMKKERHTYVLDLIIQLRQQGWLWTEEFVWHKKNPMPGKWPNRLRDGWERLLQFNKDYEFSMYQDAVVIPAGDAVKVNMRYLNESAKIRVEHKTGSGFGIKRSNWLKRDIVNPTNVVYLPNVSTNKGHSAAFPIALPTWFLKLFTQSNDIVLDPFSGSGTTALAAKRLERRYIGIDVNNDYCLLAEERVLE